MALYLNAFLLCILLEVPIYGNDYYDKVPSMKMFGRVHDYRPF